MDAAPIKGEWAVSSLFEHGQALLIGVGAKVGSAIIHKEGFFLRSSRIGYALQQLTSIESWLMVVIREGMLPTWYTESVCSKANEDRHVIET